MNNQQELIEQLYRDNKSPVFLFDEELRLLWNNAAADSLVLSRKVDKLHQLCFMPDLTAAGESLSKGISCQVNGNPLQGLGRVTLIPMETGESTKLLLAVLTKKPEQDKQPKLNEIISNVAAQYRGPIFEIHNMLAPIKKELEQNDCTDSFIFVDRIAQKCYQTMRATTNLTNYFLYTSVDSTVEKQRVDIRNFLETLCVDVRQFVRKAGIDFEYQLCNETITSMVDARKLANAIYNLIANACLYTSPGNEISLRLLKAKHDYIITVTDKGTGIPMAIQPHIFEPFFSADPSGTQYTSGCGLGLTIVKIVVEMHGGSCAVTSEMNRGTTVALRIPIEDNSGSVVVESSFDGGIMNRFSPLYLHLADICDIKTVEIM